MIVIYTRLKHELETGGLVFYVYKVVLQHPVTGTWINLK